MKKIILLLAVLFICIKLFSSGDSVSLGDGIKVAEAPLQEKITNLSQRQIDEYTVSEVATFKIKAKVLAKRNYYIGRESDLSPVDLALGWQKMSDESVLEKIKISQSGRFYYWRVKEFPIPRHEIETQSANMHLIPESGTVRRALKRIEVGDIVSFSGSLVNVDADDGWRWRSSLTRADTGNGACEVILVKDFQIVTSEYL